MKSKVKHIIIFMVFLSSFTSIFSQSMEGTFISPGIKIGYEFGKNSGFTFGLEVSYIMMDDNIFYKGLVINYDFLRNKQKLFFGVEGGFLFFGAAIGPSILIDKRNNLHFGGSIIPFFGLVGYLYYDFSFFYGYKSIQNLGLYLKYPFDERGGNLLSD
jgi:hypothetical protein